MPTFPTFSVKTSLASSSEEMAFDPVIRNQTTGYVLTAPAFTRIPRTFKRMLDNLPDADKLTFQAFEHANAGGNFDWVNEDDDVTYDVRFLGKAQYEMLPVSRGSVGWYWKITFTLEEV